MNCTLNLLLSAAFIANLLSCKTTTPPDASLMAQKTAPEIGEEVFACYKVKKLESSSSQPSVAELKKKSQKVCLNKKPLTLSITGADQKELLSWTFTGLEPLRCPSCYSLKGGKEYNATISRTAVPLIFNMTLDSRGLGGSVQLTLEQILSSAAIAGEPSPEFTEITCGDHWKKIKGIMPTNSKEASIKLSGDSLQKAVVIPAKLLRKGGELLFEASDNSGATLRIINESGKYYGVFRDSKVNDESDLGRCYADQVEPGPLN